MSKVFDAVVVSIEKPDAKMSILAKKETFVAENDIKAKEVVLLDSKIACLILKAQEDGKETDILIHPFC